MSNEVTQGVSNYLVPATGSPNAYVIKDTFTASPQSVNFQNIQLNGLAFRPSGVIIDNTKSASPLVVLIPEMSFNISCPAGASLNMPYPAPMNHTASITGAGDAEATVIFVDYPLQPYSSAQAAGSPPIPNPLSVSGPLTNTEMRATPVPVSGPATDAEMRATPIPIHSSPVGYLYGTGCASEFARVTGTFSYQQMFYVKVTNVGTADGTIFGVILKPGEIFEVSALPYSIDDLSGDATGTEFTISRVYF